MRYVLLGKLSISLRLCFFVSKMGLAVLPNWSPEVVRRTESRAGLKSQDARVCVPAKVPTNQVTLGSNFRGQPLSCPICLPKCVCVCVTHSVASGSLQRHGLQPTRLLCAWNSSDVGPNNLSVSIQHRYSLCRISCDPSRLKTLF